MDNILESLLADSSFVLWLKGKGSAEQKKKWDNWLREDPSRQKIVREARGIVDAIDTEFDPPNAYNELERLNRSIGQFEEHKRGNIPLSFRSDKHWYGQMGVRVAAAVLFIMITLGGMVGYYHYKEDEEIREQEIAEAPQVEEYHTDYGEKITFRLSDGSRIVLNANSKLKFSSRVEKGLNTEVWLEGEAYFNIAHLTTGEQQRTFTVHTDDGAIQVLGTRFAVNTFRGETKTVLEEGRISIRMDSTDIAGYQLVPGELARFKANDNKIAVKEVNTQVYTSWKEDKLIFIKTPMEEVAIRIEDTFGIEVVLAEHIADESLSGSIKSTNLDVLTEALEEILHTKIRKEHEKLFIGNI